VAAGALAAALVAAGLGASAAQADASFSVQVKKKALIVKGNGASNKLALRVRAADPDRVEVDFGDNGSADVTVKRNKLKNIRVLAGGGEDRIRIDDSEVRFTTTIPTLLDGERGDDTLTGGAGAERLIGGRGTDTVDGNGGNDAASLGAGDDRFIWDPGDGSDTVNGGLGRDTLTFNGANVAEQFDVSTNGRRVRFFRNVANITMDLGSVERIDTNALGGADQLTVNDVSGTDLRTVNGELAAALGGAAGDGQADRVIVNGRNRDDAIVATGNAGTATVTGLPATVNIAHAEAASDALTVAAQGGIDRTDASALAADAIKLTEDGGAGNDTLLGSRGADVQLGGDGNDAADGNQGDDTALLGAGDDRFTWDPGDGSDTIEGQAGQDAMTFNGANVAEQFDVSANGPRVRFLRNVANIVMDLDDVEQIDANALGGADQLTVNDVRGTDLTAVNTDVASDGLPDQVTVNATAGDDVIGVSGGAGSASVAGLAARVGVIGAEAATDTLAINALAGDDVVDGTALEADAIRLTADGGDGNDVLLGGAGVDTLLGRAGDDVLIGGPGTDVLDGGPGNNVVVPD
jgi:Ca2+-binding RTX toxin-like protein